MKLFATLVLIASSLFSFADRYRSGQSTQRTCLNRASILKRISKIDKFASIYENRSLFPKELMKNQAFQEAKDNSSLAKIINSNLIEKNQDGKAYYFIVQGKKLGFNFQAKFPLLCQTSELDQQRSLLLCEQKSFSGYEEKNVEEFRLSIEIIDDEPNHTLEGCPGQSTTLDIRYEFVPGIFPNIANNYFLDFYRNFFKRWVLWNELCEKSPNLKSCLSL